MIQQRESEAAKLIRDRYLREYNIDTSNFTDEQLIFKYGKDLEGQGLTMSDMYTQQGSDFTDQYYDIKNRPREGVGYLDEPGKGFTRGLEGEKGMFTSALGLGAGSLGLDGVESTLMDKASEYQQRASQSSPTIERASDVRWDRPEEVARFLLGAVGEVVPSVLSSAISGGVGGLTGRTIASQAGKKALKNAIENRADKSIAEAIKDVGQEVVKQKARKGFATGASVGLGANSFGLGMGEIYSELYQYTKLDPNNPDYVDPTEARAISVGFGGLSGSLDFLSAGTLLGKLIGTPKEVAADYLKRLMRGLPEGVILEGGTEATQEFINIAAEKYAKGKEFEFTNQELARMFDAGVLGAIGGAQFSAIGAIKGPPRKEFDDPGGYQPENEVNTRTQTTLDYLKKQREQEEARYAVGDDVAIALTGVTGRVSKVSGSKVEVKLDTGEIKQTTMDRLTAAIDPKEQIDQVPEPKKYEDLSFVEDATKVEEQPAPISKPKRPAGEQTLSIKVGEGDVRTKNNLTEKQTKQAQELYDTLLDLSKKDMSKNTSYANKTGGFAGNARTALASRMGEEKFKKLWTGENIQTLRDLGILDYSNQWKLGTRLDDKYDQEQENKRVEKRKNYIKRENFALNDKVLIRETNEEATIEEVLDDGMIRVQGKDEPFFPNDLKKVKIRKPRAIPKPTPKKEKPAQGVIEKEAEEEDTTPTLPVFNTNEDGMLLPRFDLAGKNISIIDLTGANGRRKAKKLDGIKDSKTFADVVRAYVTKEQKRANGSPSLNSLQGLEIDGELHGVNIDKEGFIDVAGMTITPQRVEDLMAKKAPIPFNINTMELDLDTTELDDSVNPDNSTLDSNQLIQTPKPSDISKTTTSVLLRLATNSEDSYRLVTLTLGRSGGTNFLAGYDADYGKSGGSRRIKSGEFKDYEIVGKLSSSKPIGKIDIYFETLEEFMADPKVVKHQSTVKTGVKKDDKAFTETFKKEEEEQVDEDIARLEEDAQNIEPTEEEYREARDELYIPEGEEPYDLDPSREDYLQATNEVYAEVKGLEESATNARKRIIAESISLDDMSVLESLEERREKRAREIAKERGFDTDIEKDKKVDRLAKKKAKERVNKTKKDLKSLKQAKKSSDKNKEKAIKLTPEEKQANEAAVEAVNTLSELRKAYKAGRPYQFGEGDVRVPTGQDIKDQEDTVTFLRKKASKFFETTRTRKGQFLEDAVEGSVNISQAEAEAQGSSSNASSASENEYSTSGLRGAGKSEVVDLEVGLSGKGNPFFKDLVGEEILKLATSNDAMMSELGKLARAYIEEKREQGEYSQSFYNRLNDFITSFYDTFVGLSFRPINIKDLTSFQEVVDGAKTKPVYQKNLKSYQDMFIKALELGDQGGLVGKVTKHLDYIGKAKKRLKDPNYIPYEIVNLALLEMGIPNDSPIQKSMIFMEQRDDAANMSLSDLVAHINKDNQFDSDQFLETLASIYDLSVEEESGFPFFVKGEERSNLVDEDLRKFVNYNYNKQILNEEGDQFPMGSKFTDPLSEAQINPGEQHIPNKIDPTTGRVELGNRIIVLDEVSAKASLDAARVSEQSMMAPANNPLEERSPELVDEGRSAMQSFAPEGIGKPFRLTVALNQIKNSRSPIASIGNVARLLKNNILDGYEVQFMEWKDFRPFASPRKGVLNKSVILPGKKKIFISTAFNNNPKFSAKENLMAEIVHEAMHAVTKPALDLGYAFLNGKKTEIEKAIGDHGKPELFNSSGQELAKIFDDINNKLLPYLREQGSLDQLYGLSSIDEFFSELSSDAKFIKFLRDTKLPDSLAPKKGVLQSVFDYILAILAKLGVLTPKSPENVLNYARREMDKVVDISNSSTDFYDQILAQNVRATSTLGSQLDTNDITSKYDELLERFSQTASPESDSSVINEIQSLIKGRTSPEQTPSERRVAESEALKQYARKSGNEISRASFEESLDEAEVFGGEHEVYFDEAEMRFYKANTHDTPANASVSEYLDRLALHNIIFPETAYRVEGIMTQKWSSPSGRSGERSKVVVSQQAVIGEDPSQAQIDDHMISLGFTKLEGYDKPVYRLGDIDVWDVRPGNAYVVDGNLVIFDPRIERATEANKNAEKLQAVVSGDSARRAMIERLIDETTDVDDLIGLMDEMDRGMVMGSRFTSPNDTPLKQNSMPDDNARVMAQANAAGFNEMIEEMVKVHRVLGDKLGLKIDEFIELYARPGSKSAKKIRQLLGKDLEQFGVNADDIRIEDAGLNSVSRSYGMRKAISNLERVREHARKNKASSAILTKQIEDNILSTQRIYEDLIAGRVPPRNKIGERFRSRLNAISFQKLHDYVQSLPNSGMSQADLNGVSELTEMQLMEILDMVVESRGEIETKSKEELFNILSTSNDPRLDTIKGDQIGQKVKRLALVRSIKDSKDLLSILRLSKGLVGAPEQSFKDGATLIAIAESEEAVDAVNKKFPGIQGTPLRHFAKLKKAEIKEREVLEAEVAQIEVYDLIDRSLGDRSARLRMALGELEPVNIHDGVTLVILEKDDDEPTGWKKGTYKVEIKNGKLKNREEFIRVNKNTLMGLRDEKVIAKYGNEPWWEIMKEQANLALTEPVLDEHFHAQRAAWFSGLQGMTERFSKLGYEGKKLAQMSTRTVALFRDYASKSMAYSKQFNASYHRVMSKLKLGGNELYSGLYQDIFWWLDNHPEYAGQEEKAWSELWDHLRDNANIPDRTLLDSEAGKYIRDMVNKSIIARDWEAEVNKRLGNRVRDEEIKVESFVNQEMVDFYRLPLEMGYATMPRTLNDSYIRETNRIMERAQWHSEDAQGLLQEAAKAKDEDTMQKIYSTLFTDDVVQRFVKPFTNTDVRQSVFRGPKDEDGYAPLIGNSFVNQAFKATKGDVFAMSSYIYDTTAENQSAKAKLEWQYGFLKQFFTRYGQIRKVAVRVAKEKNGMHGGESMRNTPQSLDARMVESRLPKEFFYYNMYDEVSSNIRLALMTATAAFGRNGEYANRARMEGVNNLDGAAATFNDLMSRATGSRHDKPRATYNRASKRKALAILREEGSENAEKDWNDLYTKAIAHGEFMVVFDQLGKYYGKDNVAGPYQDANLLLELLGAQSMQVLNNPKSSFWQALALFEFPNAFRGLNKIAGKATASALGNFVNQSFGGIAEAMGMQLERTGRYAQYLNNTHFRLDEMDLEFKEYNSMVGSGGDLAETIRNRPALGLKKYIRMVKNLATHHRRKNKDGTRAPIDPLTLITGIFPYMNNIVNHSVGVGAIHAYSDLILQVGNLIEERGLTEYQEFSAKDLGMGNKSGEWVIGEEDGYDRANEMLVAAGGPTISRLAFDYVDRKKSDKDAMPLDRNMALLVNQVAMNNVAGEGFNSKPSWLYTSPAMRYFSTFLGWPLGKMSRDLQFIFRDPSDKVRTYKALLKYIALMSTVYVPVGLSFAMLIDWYDEEMLEKPNNLPPISPWAALPVIGIPLAMRDENFTLYSVTSRMAKAGVPFGMGMDIMNGIFAKGDPYGAARELSLDSRIFAWSMFKNIYDAMGTWIHSGEFDWQMVGRPIAYGVGGNSVIQMMDLTTALMDIDSEERRVADYIGMRNYIKKTAFLMGLPLRPPSKGGQMPTGVSMNTRQMARAAFAGDTEDFLKQYQEALEEAKEHIAERGLDITPEKYISDAFKDRDIRSNITARKISDQDWEALKGLLPEDARSKIESAIQSHRFYLELIGGSYRQKSNRTRLSMEEARMRALTL